MGAREVRQGFDNTELEGPVLLGWKDLFSLAEI